MIEHGTISGYTNLRCRCDACREAWNAYRRIHQQELNRGEYRLVPAGEAAEHLRALRAAGFSLPAIATLTGVRRPTLNRLVSGQTKRTHPATLEAILAVELDQPAPGHKVPRERIRPMLEAIDAGGFSRRWTYRTAGLSGNWHGTRACRRVQWDTYRRIATLYRLLTRRGLVPADALEGDL